MEFHVKLEQFRLNELKEIFKKFQQEYGLLTFFKIYTLNKFDLVCLLRNSGCFDENYFNHIIFRMGDNEIKLKPKPKKTIYRGEKRNTISYIKKHIEIIFD